MWDRKIGWKRSICFVVYFKTLSVSRLCSVEWWEEWWVTKSKWFLWNRSCPNQGSIPRFAWSDWGNARKTSNKTPVSQPRFELSASVHTNPLGWTIHRYDRQLNLRSPSSDTLKRYIELKTFLALWSPRIQRRKCKASTRTSVSPQKTATLSLRIRRSLSFFACNM
jgi:hypothetical protein